MKRKRTMKDLIRVCQTMKCFLAPAVLIVFFFAGCGSSSNSNDSPGPTPPPTRMLTVKGIAAAGAPIVGTVNVRGADGVTSLSEIRSDGSFTVDVTALTPPFLIWADGSANGRSVHLYSTISAPGTVNVTPATDIIVATALKQDPYAHYQGNPDASAPAESDIDEARTLITGILSSVFASLDMPLDFDLMNGTFTVGGQGFDQILDAVAMTSEGSIVAMQDNASGTILLKDDFATEGVDTLLSASEAEKEVMPSLDAMEQIRDAFSMVIGLFETEEPSLETLSSIVRPLMSDGFLEDGNGPDDMLEEWAYAPACEGPSVGIELVTVAPYRKMVVQTLGSVKPIDMDEKAGNHAGLWCIATIRDNDRVFSFLTSFVQPLEGSPWLWFGNRNPFRSGGDVDVEAVREIRPEVTTMTSGLDVYAEDKGNAAYMRFGLTRFVILNNAFPETVDPETGNAFHALVLVRESAEATRYAIEGIPGNIYTENRGLDIDAMDSLEFVFVGLDEIGIPKTIWVDVLGEKPLKSDDLTADMFPVITAPENFADLSLSIPGLVTVSWENPMGKYVDEVDLRWWGDSGETRMNNDNPATCGNPDFQASSWLTTTFDTGETTVTSPERVLVSVQAQNETESQSFETRWLMVP